MICDGLNRMVLNADTLKSEAALEPSSRNFETIPLFAWRRQKNKKTYAYCRSQDRLDA